MGSPIRLIFTGDSKRRGLALDVASLAEARRAINHPAPKFTETTMHGYGEAWEVTCGDTVVAYAVQLPFVGHYCPDCGGPMTNAVDAEHSRCARL